MMEDKEMKRIITAAVIALLVTGAALAEEIELFWDDGVPLEGIIFDAGATPFATTFVAPADCQLITYRIFWKNEQGQGTNKDVSCRLYADDNGEPTGDTIFFVDGNTGNIPDRTWFEVDVSNENIMLSEGEVFHPGWVYYGWGPFHGSMLDTPKGSGTCWITESGDWADYDQEYTHMMRVVVETTGSSLNQSTWAGIKSVF